MYKATLIEALRGLSLGDLRAILFDARIAWEWSYFDDEGGWIALDDEDDEDDEDQNPPDHGYLSALGGGRIAQVQEGPIPNAPARRQWTGRVYFDCHWINVPPDAKRAIVEARCEMAAQDGGWRLPWPVAGPVEPDSERDAHEAIREGEDDRDGGDGFGGNVTAREAAASNRAIGHGDGCALATGGDCTCGAGSPRGGR